MKGAIAVLLAFILVGGMIVSPVSALGLELTWIPWGGDIQRSNGKVTNYSVDVSPDGLAFKRIMFDVPTGTTVDFTLYYGNGTTVTGSCSYNNDGFFQQYSEVELDGVTKGHSYTGFEEVGRIDIVGYARNWTTDTEYVHGFVIYDTLYSLSLPQPENYVFYEVDSLEDNVIYRFDMTSNNPVQIDYYTDTREKVGEAAVTTPLQAVNEWVNFALMIAKNLLDVVGTLFYWLKFFFFDNLGMTVALYLSITMAYAAATSKNIFKFFGKFFNDQRKLFEFIIGLWRSLIEIISSFRGIFRI